MATEKATPAAAGVPGWRVTIPESSSSAQMEVEYYSSCTTRLLGFAAMVISKVTTLGKKVRKIGEDDPRKVVHGVKVGIALTLVSLFYYTRPLYDGVGGSAIWAVMTVVVVFEYTVGGCLYKGFNRAVATLSAAGLAVGIHWIASKSGEKLEPIVLSASVFLLASAATFSRFIPAVKARFDYGVTIFILTYSMVAVSGYRVDELLAMAGQRMSTVAIGICIAVFVCILIRPVWSGEELHLLIARNMEKLADSLEGYVEEYQKDGSVDGDDSSSKKLQCYKCVLNSQASENSQANLARWEPMHGRFSFPHPWSQYLEVGAAMRCCAYCIEALNGCTITKTIQAPVHMKKHLNSASMRLSSDSSKVLREMSNSFKSMKKSKSVDLLVGEMNDRVQVVENALESFANQLMQATTTTASKETGEKQQSLLTTSAVPLMEVMPVIAAALLLIELSARINQVVHAANTLADLASFDPIDIQGKLSSPAPQTLQDSMHALQQV